MEVVQLIKEVGFPIAAFLLMFWLVRTSIAENTRALNELRDVICEWGGYLKRAAGNGCAGTERPEGRK